MNDQAETEKSDAIAGKSVVSLPSIQQNPSGLHARYRVEKNNGEPTDPNAVYFVLRLDDGGRDPEHIRASRIAALRYAQTILNGGENTLHLHEMASDVVGLLEKVNPAKKLDHVHPEDSM